MSIECRQYSYGDEHSDLGKYIDQQKDRFDPRLLVPTKILRKMDIRVRGRFYTVGVPFGLLRQNSWLVSVMSSGV